MQSTMTRTSLDELVSLWGDDVRPILVPDSEWTTTGILDFGRKAPETQLKVFEYLGTDALTHWVGLFEDGPVRQDVTSSLDKLVRLWGTNVRPVILDPQLIGAEDILKYGLNKSHELAPEPRPPIVAEDILHFGLTKFFEYTGADGALHWVGLVGEEDVSQAAMTSSLDDWLCGNKNVTSAVAQESTMTDVLEFALTATERQTKFFEYTGADGTPRRVGLLGKDVRLGVLVVRLLGKELDRSVHRLTSMCLANLAVSHESQVKIAALPGVLHALVSLLLENERADPSVLEQTARCLCHLAFARENQVRIASHPHVLDALVSLLLKAGSTGVLYQTAKCITHLAESRENQVKIASYSGMLSAMVKLLGKNCSSSVREQTLRCLNNLTLLQGNQVKVASHPGVLSVLVSLMGNKETTKVQWQSVKCLSALADHYQQNKMEIAAYPGALDTLVRLLEHNWMTTDRISVQEEAARCLLNLASTYQNLLKIAFHPGTLDALVGCLGKYTLQRVQDLAAECLKDLAAVPDIQGKIVNHPGALAAIVRMLKEDVNPSGQEVVAWCLNKLALAQETKVIIASSRGMLDALVRHLKKDSSSLTLQPIVRCMASLSLSTSKQVQIACHLGVLEALVSLLQKDVDSSVLEQAAKCLSLLALAPENQGKIGTYPGALHALVSLLEKDRTTGVLEQSAQCLTNLAEHKENQLSIASSPGLLQAFVSLLSKNVRPRVQEEILRCLAKLSESQENQVKIASYPGACDALMRLTARNEMRSSAPEQAARCLANLNLGSGTDKHAGFGVGGQSNVVLRRGLGQRHSSLSNPDPSYLDPITCDIMCDPVKCNDGHTYDRWTIIDKIYLDVRHPNDSNSAATIVIEMDDVDVRRRLFEAFPQQEAECSARRQKYRYGALQHAYNDAIQYSREFEDAVEKLNNVLQWAPLDAECGNELERILNDLEQLSVDPDRWDMDPLTYERMCDPVKCNDGRTYDRWTIVDRNLVRCPYDLSLKCFGIVVDDLNVRRRLFEKFPEQEATFRSRRIKYREAALQHAHDGEVEDAIKKLSNVLKWAPTDRRCQIEYTKNLNRLREQNFKICAVQHEDLVREAKRDHTAQMTLQLIFLVLAVGIWFIADSGWLMCRVATITIFQ